MAIGTNYKQRELWIIERIDSIERIFEIKFIPQFCREINEHLLSNEVFFYW